MTFAEALTECCKFGLKLLSVETTEEHKCILETVKTELRYFSGYWTSGTSAGFGCEFTWGWCSSRKLMENITWNVNEPSAPVSERCLEINTAAGFNDLPCDASVTRKFICEANFNDAFEFCCSIGMSLVSIETAAEMQVLVQIARNISNATLDLYTSGTQLDCEYHFKWCGSGERFYRNDTRWLANQPNYVNGIQNCARLVITATKAVFNDLDCAALLPFFCEAPAEPTCSAVACRDDECNVDPMKYVQSIAWKDAPNGIFRSICGKQYYFQNVVYSQREAKARCCEMGMQLLSLETIEEFNCFKNNPFGFSAVHQLWTSGTADGIGCENIWGWCNSRQNFSIGSPWKPGQPSGLLLEKCVYVEFGLNTVPSLRAFDCNNRLWYICEGDVPECRPQCPIKTCSKNASLFDSGGKIITQSQYGEWRDVCGRRYLFSSDTNNYYGAFSLCCSLGMQLLTLETNEELACLTKLNDGDMKYSGYFYSSASSQDCRSVFQFCPDTGIYVYSNDTRWNSGNPSGVEVSLLLNFIPGSPTGFADHVFTVLTRYICEGAII
ncbi:uncharacterized protein LOC135948214 [Cloeon dipterum]|uniref:uncharacterized protein LOC135948214 n=1 Tax=Cloeon dipterum TaxID=197152 RepID=UPI00321F8D0B